jgi:hypothetical protein
MSTLRTPGQAPRSGDRQHGADVPSKDRRRVQTSGHALVALQRAAGNRAVGQLVGGHARGHPGVAAVAVAQRQPGPRRPKGKVAPAPVTKPGPAGKADATPADGEPFTDAQLVRMGQATQVNVMFQKIQDLKLERIRSWAKTADLKEPKPLRAALDIAVAMVGLGMGGVFGMAISHGIKGEYLKDFVYLAKLELVDKVAVDGYEYGMREAGQALQDGTVAAYSDGMRKPNVEGALASDFDDLLGVFGEAMRLQVIAETTAQQTAFNFNAASTYKRSGPLLKAIALTVVYLQLFNQPNVFHQELTEGLIRMMDENAVAKKAAKSYGGDTKRAWEKDEGLHESNERKGNLVILPNSIGSLGRYYRPLFDFDAFHAIATGVNSKTLNKLSGRTIEELPLSLGFRYFVENPFYRLIEGGDPIRGWFTRSPTGDIYLDPDISDSAKEWFASYYSGVSRELSDDEREQWAPLGARKVYDRTKQLKLSGASNSDVF